jgi:hypothetical protein
VNSTGKLNSEQFALAMHFINKKIATGLDAPLELLPEMIPPSLRPKPTLAEDSPYSRDLEELQLQVTELQREKLFCDQRASEHDSLTRQKRTELSNLELEMESLHKTLQGLVGLLDSSFHFSFVYVFPKFRKTNEKKPGTKEARRF